MKTDCDLYCPKCHEKFCEPRILSCLHTLCFECIAKIIAETSKPSEWKVECPICDNITNLPIGGPEYLPINLVILEKMESEAIIKGIMTCTSCKSDEKAQFRCTECSTYLCDACVSSHKFMKCFNDHEVILISDLLKHDDKNELILHHQVNCPEHLGDIIKFYCQLCQVVGCGRCLKCHTDHSPVALDNGLRIEFVNNINKFIGFSQEKVNYCVAQSKHLQNSTDNLENQKEDTRNIIEDSFKLFYGELSKKRDSLLNELDKQYDVRKNELFDQNLLVNKSCTKLQEAINFSVDFIERASIDNMAATNNMVCSQLMKLFNETPQYIENKPIKFIYDYSKFASAVNMGIGYFTNTSLSEHLLHKSSYDNASRRTNTIKSDMLSSSFSRCTNISSNKSIKYLNSSNGYNKINYKPLSPHATCFNPMTSSKILNRVQSLNTDIISHSGFNPTMSDSGISIDIGNNYQDMVNKKNIMNSDISENNSVISKLLGNPITCNDEIAGYMKNSVYTLSNREYNRLSPTSSISSLFLGAKKFSDSNSISPNGSMRSHNPITGNKIPSMDIRVKFGQLGCAKLQFNSPHGFCLGIDEEIIIADTNNHRIQIYAKNGDFGYMFGKPGRDEGELWYPRKVAVIRHTGNIIICDRGNERSRMQMFTRHGIFIKKIIIRYIDIVAGLAVSPEGHIIAVDSVSPTVFRISENGELIKWFDCSEYMREPSDIAIWNNDYYVCDFKGHCVVVFNAMGDMLRRIGQETITSFPNGIDISNNGDILVGDSHGNRFHIAVFQNDGTLVGEFECPHVKVSRCCGLKISVEGYVITLAKNNHHVLVLHTLYIT